MAQIKKIVKPGDLIRGAKIGVAGLDKDGNVIGVPGVVLPTPTAEDVGKVPVVQEDGSIAYEEVSGGVQLTKITEGIDALSQLSTEVTED